MLSKQRSITLTHAIVTATGGLEMTIGQSGASRLVRLNGRVNIDSSPEFRDQLLALLQRESSEAIMVDLADVPYMDTSGIATLIEALKIARHRKIVFCLRGLTGSVLHLFEVTGLLALFEASGCLPSSSESNES
jgi:anti-sigma B factor antagonist